MGTIGWLEFCCVTQSSFPHFQAKVTSSCEHVAAAGGVLAFAHGMCRECFVEYLKTSGGIYEVWAQGVGTGCGQCGGGWGEGKGEKGIDLSVEG